MKRKHTKTPQLKPDWNTGIYTGDSVIAEEPDWPMVSKHTSSVIAEQKFDAFKRIHIRTEADMDRLWDTYGMACYHLGDLGIILVDHRHTE